MGTIKTVKLNLKQQEIFNYISECIIDKLISVGDRLPTEMELAKKFDTNRMNSHKALNHLESVGLIVRNRKGGTIVAEYPNSFTIGEMRNKTDKTITVLNPLPAETRHLHWNDEIESIFETNMKNNGINIIYTDISKVKTVKELADIFRQSAHGGVSAVLFITYGPFNEMIENNPDLFFNLQRNIFVYAREDINWSIFPYNIVSIDSFNEGVTAGEYIIESNSESIFFGLNRDVEKANWLKARLNGLNCAITRSSVSCRSIKTILWEQSFEDFYSDINAGRKVMLVCAADKIAVDFITKIDAESGYIAGENYRLVSFNNDPRFIEYQLTSIAPPLTEIGKTLSDLIIKALTKKNDRTSYIKIRSIMNKGVTG